MFPYYVKATCFDYNGAYGCLFAKHPLTDEYFDRLKPRCSIDRNTKDKKKDLKKDLTNYRTIYNMAENEKPIINI